MLTVTTTDGQYDLENTLSNTVFDYVKLMQEFEVKTECTYAACPYRIQRHPSVEISLKYVFDWISVIVYSIIE